MWPFRTIAALLAGTALSAGPSWAGQTISRQNPPFAVPSLHGADLFQFHCATCHGREGKGDGPTAKALKSPPPDLTRIASRNGGKFPSERIERFVTDGGDGLAPSHGSKEMPVWGPIFRSVLPSDTEAKTRIKNLISYVESIQSK
jgi:mono/diheme cytochrome c family protein